MSVKKTKRCACGITSINSGCFNCSKYKLKVMLSPLGKAYKAVDPRTGRKVGPVYLNFVKQNNLEPQEIMDYMKKTLIDKQPYYSHINLLILYINAPRGAEVLRQKP